MDVPTAPVVELLATLGWKMNDAEFNRVVITVAQHITRAQQYQRPIQANPSRPVIKSVSNEIIIKAQAELINEEMLKVDCLNREKKELKAENMRLRITIGWLRETHRPMGVSNGYRRDQKSVYSGQAKEKDVVVPATVVRSGSDSEGGQD